MTTVDLEQRDYRRQNARRRAANAVHRAPQADGRQSNASNTSVPTLASLNLPFSGATIAATALALQWQYCSRCNQRRPAELFTP